MKLYESKPEIVEAQQWDRKNPFAGGLSHIIMRRIDKSYVAQVTGGPVLLKPGDWIVKRASGMLDVMADAAFRAKFSVPEKAAPEPKPAPKKKTTPKKKATKKKVSKKS